MDERENRIREIAHRLWEVEGRPSDQEKRHWDEAARIVDEQDRVTNGAPDSRSASGQPDKPGGEASGDVIGVPATEFFVAMPGAPRDPPCRCRTASIRSANSPPCR